MLPRNTFYGTVNSKENTAGVLIDGNVMHAAVKVTGNAAGTTVTANTIARVADRHRQHRDGWTIPTKSKDARNCSSDPPRERGRRPARAAPYPLVSSLAAGVPWGVAGVAATKVVEAAVFGTSSPASRHTSRKPVAIRKVSVKPVTAGSPATVWGQR